MKTWLLLDANCLAYRVFHTTGHLAYGEQATGTIFGFLRDVLYLKGLHATEDIAFCFDFGKPLRSLDYEEYKSTRAKARLQLDPEAKKARWNFLDQVDDLREIYLERLGYRNVFWHNGYEADDLIASIVRYSLGKQDRAIIVSSDKDYYQLLDQHPQDITIWNPHTSKMISRESFIKAYGIEPSKWIFVKCLAGCLSDDIPGIEGVGEKIAIKFLNHQVNPKTEVGKRLLRRADETIAKNTKLVTIPYPNTPRVSLREDALNQDAWSSLCEKFGMGSLANQPLQNAKNILSDVVVERRRR